MCGDALPPGVTLPPFPVLWSNVLAVSVTDQVIRLTVLAFDAKKGASYVRTTDITHWYVGRQDRCPT